MTKAAGYLIAALFMAGVGVYSVVSIHKIAQPFIEMTVSGAETTRDLLANKENIIRSITPEQRQTWLENLSDPELEATGIVFIRNIASYIIAILFIGYVWQFLVASYKSYKK